MDTTVKEAKALVKELKSLMGLFDEKSVARQNEISFWFRDHRSPETDAIFSKFMDDGLTAIETEVNELRRQISDEDYRLLPISHIAHKYFGKSHAWLSQRINGTPVRGRVYTLNEEQKQIFNNAMQDLSRFYGSFRLA